MLLRGVRRKEHCSGYTTVSATQQNKQFSLMKALSTEEHQSVERLGHYPGSVLSINAFSFVGGGK